MARSVRLPVYPIKSSDTGSARGVSLSGLEFSSGTIPGGLNIDYFENSNSDYVYFKQKGFNIVRVPFLWERIQPTALGALDTTAYVTYLQDNINWAKANGMKVLLDLHNYGRRAVISNGGFTSSFTSTPDYLWSGGSQTSGSPGYMEANNFQHVTGGTPNNPVTPNTTYSFQCDAKIVANGGVDVWRALWLQAFKADENNFLFFNISNLGAKWELGKRVAGVDTVLATGAGTFNVGTNYTLKMDIGQTSAGNIQCFIDGVLKTTTPIPTGFTKGYIGLFVNGVQGRITNCTLNVNGDTTSGRTGTGTFRIGDPEVTQAMFTDVWTRIAQQFLTETGIWGYDLMNEPHDMPTPTTSSNYNTTSTWYLAAQAAINAIRAVDTSKYIVAQTDNWSGSQSFVSSYGANPTPWWTDSANKLWYSVHSYWDSDNSGQYNSSTGAYWSGTGHNITYGGDNAKTVLDWAKLKGVKTLFGEFGTPNYDDAFSVQMNDFYNIIDQYQNVITCHWASGDQYTAITTLEPSGTFTIDKKQMEIVQKHLGSSV